MTRIRKNWSSSRGAEDPETTVRPHVVVARDSQMTDKHGKQASPILLQLGLDIVNEDAIHMLAAVSLEHDNNGAALCNNVKLENSSAKVAVNAKSLEHEDGTTHHVKRERTSPKTRDHRPSCTQGDGPMTTQHKKGHWFQNLSPLDLWPSDRGLVAVTTAFTEKEVDDEQSKSSSVADNEAKQDPAAAEPVQGLISELMQVHNPERNLTNKKVPRVLQDLGLRFPAGRKKRQKLWESELGPRAIGGEDCKIGQQQQKTQKPAANGDGDGIGNGDRRSTVKTSRIAAQDQGAACNRNKARLDSQKILDEQDCGAGAGPAADGGENKDEKDVCSDGGQYDDGHNAAHDNVENVNGLLSKSGKAVNTNASEKRQLKSARMEVLPGNDIDDSTPLSVKLEKARGNNDAADDRKRKRVTSKDEDGDGDGERKKLRVKPSSKTQGGAQEGTGGEDIFPKGWKYKGLAQIAERDEATHGQIKKLCGRTDGHNWRCPLRVVEGLSLCQHHLNKAREKKLGRNSHQKKQSSEKKQPSDAAASLPPPSSHPPADLLTLKGPVPSADQHAPTKFRRRHKTAKLSVL